MFLQRVVSMLLRLVLVLAGLVFGAVLLVAGLVFAVVLVVWSLLRGRRPQAVRFRMKPGAPFDGMRRNASPADVVDIEAREVPDTPHTIERDKS
ncbi:MAG: hypothetical protein KF891_02050 [Rhizobacter sp.]|nr:hypothetical protein [Rhizobacter sp.]